MIEQGFWNGLPTEVEKGTAVVADAPEFPLYWAKTEGIIGERIAVVRVVLDGVNYGGGTAYLDDRDGAGSAKVAGGGSPRAGHSDVVIEPESFEPSAPPREITREVLVEICERSVVPVAEWRDRDTPRSQERLGTAWALLKAGCVWRIAEDMYRDRPQERDETIWIYITYPGFGTFDWGAEHEEELFYLPTEARLKRRTGEDWY